MKKVCLFIPFIFFLVSCSERHAAIDMLEDASRWSGEGTEISDGIMTVKGEYKTFVYDPGFLKTFGNFELNGEFMTDSGGCVALAFHTRSNDPARGYEVTIDNSQVGSPDRQLKTGSLSLIRNIQYHMVDNGVWFNMRIRVSENHIGIWINNYPVVLYTEPEVPFRTAALEKRILSSGTFAIRSDYGNTAVHIRSLSVKKLPRGEITVPDNPDFVKNITQLNIRKIPVVDYHVHMKGDLTMDTLVKRSAELGINYGIAANCGLKFPIQNDHELEAYLASIDGLPIFKAMQAEGREWVDMFSPDLVAGFDYAFTDAMTWTNSNGTRMRLWIPEETEVGDPEDFMDQLVAQIEKIVTEPISIYVNPTYLPAEIADRYDELWTDARIDRVVNALAENNVALEINSRLKLPGKRVIRKAKEAGVKFAMGTNNTSAADLGQLDWALQMVEDLNLQPTDMFLPGPK